MKRTFALRPPADQNDLGLEPYDYWINPAGDKVAEFFRRPDGFLVRFLDQADFSIDFNSLAVSCTPAPGLSPATAQSLFLNSIRPIIESHFGGLYLHGSAVAIGKAAVAFTGPSRRGKTTLAGAFAKAGMPFMTEDVIQLEPSGADFLLCPRAPPAADGR